MPSSKRKGLPFLDSPKIHSVMCVRSLGYFLLVRSRCTLICSSTSSAGIPSIDMILSSPRSPATISILFFRIPSALARKAITARLALPSTGGAATRIRSVPSSRMPPNSVFRARGVTRTVSAAPLFPLWSLKSLRFFSCFKRVSPLTHYGSAQPEKTTPMG